MESSITASLIAPVFNEEGNIDELVRQIYAAMENSGITWELLLIDDASTDSSWAKITAASAKNSQIRGIRLAHNGGQSGAFSCGFKNACGNLIVTLDADLQNDPEDIPIMLAKLVSENADGVIGYRHNRNDSFSKKLSSKIANAYRRNKTNDATIDTGCSLKVFKREFLDDFPNFSGMHRYIPTLAKLAGAENILQVPVNHRPRLHGVSKYGIWDRLWVGLADVRAVCWMQ